MAQHVWSVLCREPIIDRLTNNMSLVNILEEVQVEIGVPVTTVHIVSFWVRDPVAKGVVEKLRARILSPTGKQIGTIEHQFSMVEHIRARNVLTAHGLPLADAGRYAVEIQEPAGKTRWRTVARLPLDVTISMREAAPESAAA